jgi:hypothetical protein
MWCQAHGGRARGGGMEHVVHTGALQEDVAEVWPRVFRSARERERGARLRVHVQDEDPEVALRDPQVAGTREGRAEVDGRGGLRDAALPVDDGDLHPARRRRRAGRAISLDAPVWLLRPTAQRAWRSRRDAERGEPLAVRPSPRSCRPAPSRPPDRQRRGESGGRRFRAMPAPGTGRRTRLRCGRAAVCEHVAHPLRDVSHPWRVRRVADLPPPLRLEPLHTAGEIASRSRTGASRVPGTAAAPSPRPSSPAPVRPTRRAPSPERGQPRRGASGTSPRRSPRAPAPRR